MIDLSLAGLIGAFLGTAVAGVAYAPLVSSIERHLRARAASESAGDESRSSAEQATLRQEMALLRRSVLAADIMVFAGLGYWLAATLAG
jgi:hypothetical protein